MTKKSQERLRWALRYILCHPDTSSIILGEEWSIEEERALEICAMFVEVIINHVGSDKDFKKLEKEIFKKMVDLK